MIKRENTLVDIAQRILSIFIFTFFVVVLVAGWAQGRDFSWALKEPFETRLTQETGHPVAVEGAIGFRASWTELRLFAGDITTNLGDEESALEASVFAERAGVTLGLWDLMRGRVSLRGLLLREARITLPVPEDAGTQDESPDRNPEFIFQTLNRLHRVTLDNLTIIRLRRDAEPQVAEVDSLIIAPADGSLQAAFVGDVDGTPYDVSGVIEDLESFLEFDGSRATIIASIGNSHVEGQGTVMRIWPFEADLDLVGDAQNVARLAELLGANLPGAGAGRLTGHLSVVERRAQLSLSSLEIDHNGANGEAPALVIGPANGSLDITRSDGNRFRITGALASEFVRIDPLFAARDNAARRTLAEVIETPIGTGLPFAERRIPFAEFERFEGEVRLEAAELHFLDAIFEDVSLPLSDADGVLRIENATASFEGRSLSLSFMARAADQSVQVEAHAYDVSIGALTEALGGNSFIHGPTLIAVEGSGTGATVGEVLQSFTGQSNLMVGRGRLESGGIDFLAADLLRSLFSEGGLSTTPLVCLINRIDFDDGVGTSRAFLMDTNLITITGQGRVNLARNNIDFRLAPRPKDPTLLSLAADYKVEGPILSPSIMPEAGGIIRGVATTLGSLALTGGAAALLPLLVGSGDDDELSNPCIAALIGEDVPPEEEIPASDEAEVPAQ